MKKTNIFAVILASAMTLGASAQEIDFAKHIWPILNGTCVKCHGPDKQKGKLRLDSSEAALKSVIVPGKPDESELYLRITLPADDDDIMPPKDGPLAKEQIALIKQWIEAGAEWGEIPPDTPEVAQETPAAPGTDVQSVLQKLSPEELAALKQFLAGGGELPAAPKKGEAPKPVLVEAEPSEAENAAVASLRETGALVMKVAQNVNWLRANFRLVGDSITDEVIAPLADIPNLIELDLSRTKISDDGLAHIANLSNLTHLNLNNTAITDAGLAHVKGLRNLSYLNLYGTKVSDAGLNHLQGIPTLAKLYIWQTDVTDEGTASLAQKLPTLEVIGGWTLPVVETEAETEDKDAEAEKKTSEAKAEEKPEEKAQAAAKKASGPTIAKLLLQVATN